MKHFKKPDKHPSCIAMNRPYRLPHDFMSFLEVTNGLSLQWDIKMNASNLVGKASESSHWSDTECGPQPFGRINVNNIDTVNRINLQRIFAGDDIEDINGLFRHENAGISHQHAGDKPNQERRKALRVAAAFDLDRMCGCGTVALVYFHNTDLDKPRVYFQDLSCTWWPLASSFSEYFRLLMMHLGIPNWQYSFTSYGLDEVTSQWFNLLSPERLAIDLDSATIHRTNSSQVTDRGHRRPDNRYLNHRGYIGRSSARRNRESFIKSKEVLLQQPDRRDIEMLTKIAINTSPSGKSQKENNQSPLNRGGSSSKLSHRPFK